MDKVRRNLGWLAALVLAAGGLACTSVGGTTTAATTAGPCFSARDISHFVPLEGRFVYVEVRTNEHYLLTLDRAATNLNSAWNIIVSPNYDRVCWDGRAPIYYYYLGQVAVYRIMNIESVKDEAEARALAAQRTPS